MDSTVEDCLVKVLMDWVESVLDFDLFDLLAVDCTDEGHFLDQLFDQLFLSFCGLLQSVERVLSDVFGSGQFDQVEELSFRSSVRHQCDQFWVHTVLVVPRNVSSNCIPV